MASPFISRNQIMKNQYILLLTKCLKPKPTFLINKLTDAKVILFYELIYDVKYQNRNLRPFPNVGTITPINFGR